MRGAEKLSATKIAKIRQPGRYGDGRGLWLYVAPGGSRSWVLRYMRGGVAREMGLGPLPDIGLAAARERAREARRLILDGADPIEARRERRSKAKLEAARGITFKDAADQYIAAHKAGWRNPTHRGQWTATLATYVFPTMGALPVSEIDTAIVLRALQPIWSTKTETASRVRGRIEVILDWAKARGFRHGDNPSRWRGHLDKLLPAKSKLRRVQHLAAMPYADLPAFMGELRAVQSVTARALEFTALTACRTSEAIKSRWPEIDFATKVWTIPGSRMKAGREHRVPLSDRVIEILHTLPREDDGFIFPGAKARLADTAMVDLLAGMTGNAYTVHCFRSTFRDWAAEQTNYPRELAEAALAHVVRDKTEAAYQRGDLLEKRARLMRDWASFCSKPPIARSGVVEPIRGGAGHV
jgi:integrase